MPSPERPSEATGYRKNALERGRPSVRPDAIAPISHEVKRATGEQLSLNKKNRGGFDLQELRGRFSPGTAAIIDGKKYKVLQYVGENGFRPLMLLERTNGSRTRMSQGALARAAMISQKK